MLGLARKAIRAKVVVSCLVLTLQILEKEMPQGFMGYGYSPVSHHHITIPHTHPSSAVHFLRHVGSKTYLTNANTDL